MRIAHNELIYTLREFKELNGGEICRRYNFGDWLDYWQDEQAAKEVSQIVTDSEQGAG